MGAVNRAHLERMAALGCIVCRRQGYGKTPAEIHHLRANQGMGQRASDFEAIPLCPQHHRLGGHGVAYHAGRQAFEARYGTERELLDVVRVLLRDKTEADGEGF